MIILLMTSIPVQPFPTPHSHPFPLGMTLSMTSDAVIRPQVQDICHLHNHMPTSIRSMTADSASGPVTCLLPQHTPALYSRQSVSAVQLRLCKTTSQGKATRKTQKPRALVKTPAVTTAVHRAWSGCGQHGAVTHCCQSHVFFRDVPPPSLPGVARRCAGKDIE